VKAPRKKKEGPSDRREALLSLLERTSEIDPGANVEFKSTLRFNLKTSSADKELSKAVAKTICAFMNADGGTLFIGVGDHKEAIGIEKDIQGLSKRDEDGFISTLYQLVLDMIGTEFWQLVRPTVLDYQGKRICGIEVQSSSAPAWFIDGNSQTFYVRIGNRSMPQAPREALKYILKRFKGM
jgi:predicted HTH transcriptional regulator